MKRRGKYSISKKIALSVFFLAVTLFMVDWVYLKIEKNSMGEDPVRTEAVVIAINLSQPQGNPLLKYEFTTEGETYQGFQRYNPEWEKIDIGETCIVMYERSNPKNNKFDSFGE